MTAPELTFEEKVEGYAEPRVLVSTEWVAGHLEDPQVRVVEADEDVLLYEVGHVPGSVNGQRSGSAGPDVEADYNAHTEALGWSFCSRGKRHTASVDPRSPAQPRARPLRSRPSRGTAQRRAGGMRPGPQGAARECRAPRCGPPP